MFWWARRWQRMSPRAAADGRMAHGASVRARVTRSLILYTSDPLMHLLGPVLMLAIDRGRFGAATAVLGRRRVRQGIRRGAARDRRGDARTAGTMAGDAQADGRGDARDRRVGGVAVVGAHAIALHDRPDLFRRCHHRRLCRVLVVDAEHDAGDHARHDGAGGLWLLWPAGLYWGPRELRQLTFASVPALLVFNALQQPDRALWNFAFLVMPAVAIVLDRAPHEPGLDPSAPRAS